ncbi:MAG: carbohydrate ABC transporter permease [Lachnospiraceae bacterium]|jgi:multiple sugar transport system permease protein|nr:carbohydrate ABC transporter permease [Lachnospiraceae bacterium]
MKKSRTAAQIVIHVILILLAVICLTPFLSMISSSFMDIRGVLPDIPVIFPKLPLFVENYAKVWTANNFSRYFLNTLVISVGGLVVNVVISVSMAYSFARFKFPGREAIFNIFLLTMMVPAQLALISQYTVLNGLKLIDNYAGVLLLWGGTCVAGNTFFYRGFFESVPKELEESMFLDGASRFQVLTHCIIPLCKPAIGTSAIFAFNGYWSDLFNILTFIKTEEKRTLSVALQLFRGQHTTEYGLMFAASVIVIIPVIVIFIIFQKQFMRQGLMEGAVKG